MPSTTDRYPDVYFQNVSFDDMIPLGTKPGDVLLLSGTYSDGSGADQRDTAEITIIAGQKSFTPYWDPPCSTPDGCAKVVDYCYKDGCRFLNPDRFGTDPGKDVLHVFGALTAVNYSCDPSAVVCLDEPGVADAEVSLSVTQFKPDGTPDPFSSAPEPSSFALGSIGLLALFGFCYRSDKK